jgi:ribosomally synthesized peptide (two-chain TOMM family)
MSDQSNQPKGEVVEWQRVWLKAVALAWRDATFKAHLMTDANQAIQKYLHYDMPRNLKVKVVEESQPIAYAENTAGWVLPPVEMLMTLPPKPAGIDDHGIALADLVGWNAHTCADTCCF